MNMGTPGHPEGVPHWSNKAMYSHKLERRRKRQQGFWLFFKECCGQCEGGGFVENILADVTAVKSEADYGGFRPDILLERGDKPPIWLEVTHTSLPSPSKLAYCADQGIDVFELEGSQRPVDSTVRKAHISPRNCRKRQRQRLVDLWRHMASLDDPKVGIKEDFRSPERQCREREAFWAEVNERGQDVADGKLHCARCGEPFTGDGGGFSVSFTLTHRPDGGCGEVPFCQQCNFAIGGGWDGVYPDDADSWGLDGECPACQPILAEQEKHWDEATRRRSLRMPESYGSRLVQEPERRQQEYIVGDQPISRTELQSVLIMFKYILGRVLQTHPKTGMMLREVNKIESAVLYANNIHDWDWLEGIGESYVSDHDAPDVSKGDKFLYPKWWWPVLPPCPLTIV